MSREAMKLALGKIKSARDCHPNAVDTLLFEAEEILEGALAQQPARPYRLLQDNGSKYFGDSWDKAEQPAQQALDKMAENARELGLDYEPAQQEPVAWLELLREARDNCKASIVEEGISASRKEYRIDLEARLTAALNSSPPAQRKPLTDEDCTRIYNEANGITIKNPPITTERIFKAMRAAHSIKENT